MIVTTDKVINKSYKGAKVYCQYEPCGKLIPKKKNETWKVYSTRKYCDSQCVARNRAEVNRQASNAMELPDGTILPLGNYIKQKTANNTIIADYSIGLVKKVAKIDDDAEDAGTYKGLPIDMDMLKSANRFLVENSEGRPGQRKPPDEKVKRSENELVLRLQFLIKKLVKNKEVAGKILELLEGEGL